MLSVNEETAEEATGSVASATPKAAPPPLAAAPSAAVTVRKTTGDGWRHHTAGFINAKPTKIKPKCHPQQSKSVQWVFECFCVSSFGNYAHRILVLINKQRRIVLLVIEMKDSKKLGWPNCRCLENVRKIVISPPNGCGEQCVTDAFIGVPCYLCWRCSLCRSCSIWSRWKLSHSYWPTPGE